MSNQIKIKIIGKNPNYFLKKIIYYPINIYSLEIDKNSLIITVLEKDYNIIKKIKTSYKIVIMERYGKNKFSYILKKYWYLLLFIVLGISLIYFFSNYIFEVEIVHPNKKLVEIIKEDLKEYGIEPYHFKVNYLEKEKIKEKLLLKEKNLLEWIEIEEKGTKYIVTIEERKTNKLEETCLPRNIVSKKNAIIIDIKASAGEIVRKKDEYVSRGETIISGFIYNKDRVVAKRCSKGIIYGEVWYKVRVLLPKEKKEKRYLSNKKIGGFFLFFSKEWSMSKKYSIFEKSEYNIIESMIVPIKVGMAQYQEIKWDKKIYTSQELENKALSLAEESIAKNFHDEEKVLMKKVLKKREKNSKIEIEVFLKVKEDITDYQDISEIEIREEE